MKTAYKDLKSKLKNNHGSSASSSSSSSRFHAEENNNHHHNHSSSSSSSFSKSREHRRSAPSSPVFSKGPRSSSASSANAAGATSTLPPNSPQSMQISMQPSSSNTLPTQSNYAYSSATVSPVSSGQQGAGVPPLSGSTSSSSSMSEINLQLWQELQHHDLFKSPPVDRSVSEFN